MYEGLVCKGLVFAAIAASLIVVFTGSVWANIDDLGWYAARKYTRGIIARHWRADLVDNGESVHFSLYKKDFSTGTVTLGGNEGGGQPNCSMYTVVVIEQ